MMKRKRSTAGIIMALLICAMAVSVVFTGTPVRAEGGSSSDVLGVDKDQPAGYSDAKETDPYGSIGDTPFLLSEQNELFGYWGHHKAVYGRYYNDLDMTIQGNGFLKSVNKVASGDTSADMSGIGYGEDAYRFVRGISFDPTGSGRRDHAAYIGWDPTNGCYTCFVRKPTGSAVYKYTLDTANWINSTSPYYFEVISKMAITAGDYDGDGKDSLIVYVCGDGANVVLYEIRFDGSAFSKTRVLDLGSVLVNTGYRTNEGVKFKPIVTLATGDFDGDGMEEFAYSAGFHNDSNSARDGWNEDLTDIRKYTTCVGVGDHSDSWNMKAPVWMYDKGKTGTFSSYEMTAYTLMHGGTIAAGDLDGEGADEIIVVGYTSNGSGIIQQTGAADRFVGACDVDQNNYVTSVIRYDANTKTYTRSGLTTLSMSTFGKDSMDNIKDSRHVYMPITVACGNTNGKSAPADVFIAGQIYSFAKGSAQVVHTPLIMTQTFNTILDDSTQTDVFWVNDVAVGNFNHNDAGREQFVYTLWFKKSGGRSSNVYMGIMGGAQFSDETDSNGNITQFGTCTKYASSNIRGDYSGWVDENETASASKVIKERDDTYCNSVFVAADVNQDGILAKRSQSNGNNGFTGYVYTDPEVITVLQAGPYFAEVDNIGGYADPCGTSYTIETEYGYTSSTGDNVSFGVGFAGELEGAVVRASIEAGYTMDWSQTFEKEYTETHSSSFTAQEEDQVIVSRVPEVIYCYDIYKNGKWVKNGHTVRVPLAPAYFQLGVDEYNSLVDEYNAIAQKAGNPNTLIKITDEDLPPDNEGNPFNYRKTEWSKSEPQLSKAAYALTSKGGYSTGEWSSGAASTVSTEMAHGFSFSVTVQGGISVGGVGGWAGGYVNLDYSSSSGRSTTKGTTKGAAGQVQNISRTALSGKLTSDQIESYAFTWEFGTWSRTLQNGRAPVPFYGYRVYNVRALAPRVTDLSIGLTTDAELDPALELTWSDPAETNRPVAEYVLYMIDEDGDSEAIAVLPASQTGYILKAEGNYKNKYAVTTRSTVSAAVESIVSEEVGLKPSQKTQAEAAIAKVKEDKAKAEAVETLINALPAPENVSTDNYTEVNSAREAFNALTEDQKARVRPALLEKLVAAEARCRWSGEGTESSPYLITSEEDWNKLAECMDEGNQMEGKYFKLTHNISVSVPIGGDRSAGFAGIFDGNGKTIHVTLEDTGDNGTAIAPFGRISGAVIRHLKVTGTVVGTGYCSGLAGCADGTNYIEDCLSSVQITCGDHAGGLIGNGLNSETTLEGCVFNGSINGNNANVGAIWGWSDPNAAPVLINCFEAGDGYGNSRLNPVGLGGKNNGTAVTNTYYTTDPNGSPDSNWSDAGRKAYAIHSEDIYLDLGEGTMYPTAGITAYPVGMRVNNVLYAGSGETLHFTMSDPSDEGLVASVSAGTLSGEGTDYTLVMPESDVVLTLTEDPAIRNMQDLLNTVPDLETMISATDKTLAENNCSIEELREIIGTLENGKQTLIAITDAYNSLGAAQKEFFRIAEIRKAEDLSTPINDLLGKAGALLDQAKASWFTALVLNLPDIAQSGLADEAACLQFEEDLQAARSAVYDLTIDQRNLVTEAVFLKLDLATEILSTWQKAVGEGRSDQQAVDAAVQKLEVLFSVSADLDPIVDIMENKADRSPEDVADAFTRLNNSYDSYLSACEEYYYGLTYPQAYRMDVQGKGDILHKLTETAKKLGQAAYHYYDADELEGFTAEKANAERLKTKINDLAGRISSALFISYDEAISFYDAIRPEEEEIRFGNYDGFLVSDLRTLAWLYGIGAFDEGSSSMIANDILVGSVYETAESLKALELQAQLQNYSDVIVIAEAVSGLPDTSVLTTEEESTVNHIRELYNDLTEEQKGLVESRYTEKLADAETEIAELKKPAADLSGASVTVEDQTFTGAAVEPEVAVVLNGKTLAENVDYTVSYQDNTEPGTASVIITGIRKYTGAVTRTFTIRNDPSITFRVLFKDGWGTTLKKDHVSFGEAATAPEDPVKYGYVFLGWDTAFDRIVDNTVVTALWAESDIEGAEVKLSKTSFTYNGKVQKPTIRTIGGQALIEGTDYEIEWSNASSKNAGTYTLTITGLGSYRGTTAASYTIKQAAQNITVNASTVTLAVGKTKTLTVTGASGKVTYASSAKENAAISSAGKITAKKVGTATITVKAAATTNYKAASVKVTVKVTPAAVSSFKAASTAKGTKLTWKKVTGAAGYKVYRGTKLIKTIKSASTVTYTDTGAKTNGTKYTFKVIAYASTGNGTAKSVTNYYVSSPTPKLTTTAKKLKVSWSQNTKATGYEIWYGTNKSFKSGTYKKAAVTSKTTVSKTFTAASGKTYYVKIRTYKTVSGKKYYSDWSAVKSVKVK